MRQTPLALALAAAVTTAAPSHAAVGRAWLDARAALRDCLDKPADVRGACLEAAARAMDEAELRGEGPLPTPAQRRHAEARDYGLRPAARPAPPVAAVGEEERPRRAPSRLRTTVTAARQDAGGNWIMTTAEGAVWAQTDGSPLSRPPIAGSTLEVRPAALGSYFCLINDRREVRCRRRS